MTNARLHVAPVTIDVRHDFEAIDSSESRGEGVAVPNERVVEIDEFETDDPSLQGEMRMTISLEDVADGTEVVGLHDGIPPGVALADNELGWQSAFSRLAALVERCR